LLSILGLLVSSLSFAQQQDSFWKEHIDSIVQTTDSQKGKPEKFRWLFSNYEYKMINETLVKIVRKYKAGPSEKTDIFYVVNMNLVYSEEKEYSYYLHGDTSKLIGKYYFEKGKLKDYVTIGHEKSEMDNWEPEEDVLKKYKEAVKRINSYLIKNGKKSVK
jgi:hypothetical protein